MNEFIEKNKGLLKFYCVAARIIGWALLLTLLWNQLGGKQWLGPPPEVFPYRISYPMLGLVVLGIGQFLKYLCETGSKPGWILHHADKILYLYAMFSSKMDVCRLARISDESSSI